MIIVSIFGHEKEKDGDIKIIFIIIMYSTLYATYKINKYY